jgi:uncharacterized membrane protein
MDIPVTLTVRALNLEILWQCNATKLLHLVLPTTRFKSLEIAKSRVLLVAQFYYAILLQEMQIRGKLF